MGRIYMVSYSYIIPIIRFFPKKYNLVMYILLWIDNIMKEWLILSYFKLSASICSSAAFFIIRLVYVITKIVTSLSTGFENHSSFSIERYSLFLKYLTDDILIILRKRKMSEILKDLFIMLRYGTTGNFPFQMNT